MNKPTQIFIASVFVIGMSLLYLYLDKSLLSIGIILGLGFFGGIVSSFFVGYFIPNQIIFRARFIIRGFGFGVIIGLVLFFVRSNEDQVFLIRDLVLALIISVPIGVIGTGFFTFLKYRKLKKKTIGNHENDKVISDFATYIDSNLKTTKGLLALSVDKLSFYAETNQDCLFETPLTDINIEIEKSKFMNIPIGFSFENKKDTINVAFPFYWLKLMGIENK